jgi:dihydroxyacetone kinase-like predicted kinase
MRSTIEEAYRAPDRSASAVAQAMAHGALMGARGNSGVILSQMLRGLAQSLTEKESLTAADLASALQESAAMAYKCMSNPVEGTMLTVIKDIATAVQAEVASDDWDVVAVMETAVNAAGESVANTPNLLDVLRQAGVVDAGGQGLHTIFDGALRYLKGEMEQMRFRKPQIIVTDMHATKLPQMIAADEMPYGYCTEFLLKGEKLETDKMRKKLEKKGESLIVVGDDATARVHIHTLEPGDVISYASSLGTGEGLSDVFTSLGVTAIVPGGQTMNPSTKDLLQAVEGATSDKVIILPNNKNIVATANQVQSLTEKKIEVVPTTTIPQGVAALLAFDYEANLESNIQIMTRAMATVKTIEICRAVRSAKLGDLKIKKKQPIGFLDGDMVVVGESGFEVLNKMLSTLGLSKVEVITIYYGADTKSAEAEQVASDIRSRYPQLQIEVVKGGQPHYNYIISIE